jgi:hypothetical protein
VFQQPAPGRNAEQAKTLARQAPVRLMRHAYVTHPILNTVVQSGVSARYPTPTKHTTNRKTPNV